MFGNTRSNKVSEPSDSKRKNFLADKQVEEAAVKRAKVTVTATKQVNLHSFPNNRP